MISGSKIGLDRGVRVLLLMLACATSSAWAFDLPQLMGLLAQQKSGEGRFTEQRFVRGIEGPLDASGTLSFRAPDQLTRRTLTPRPETMVVDGNTLTLTRSGRTRTMTLDSMPELLGMVEAMRGTLSGNAGVLQRYFRTTLSGTAARWSLELVPVDERLAAQQRGQPERPVIEAGRVTQERQHDVVAALVAGMQFLPRQPAVGQQAGQTTTI